MVDSCLNSWCSDLASSLQVEDGQIIRRNQMPVSRCQWFPVRDPADALLPGKSDAVLGRIESRSSVQVQQAGDGGPLPGESHV